MSWHTDRIPCAPFQQWIENRIAFHEKQWEFGGEKCAGSDALQRTAFDLGLSLRRLNGYRRGVKSAKPNGHGRATKEVPTDTFSREAVEEALWCAGVFLWEVYLEADFPALYEVTDDEEAVA
jgi:hypothetical protein